MKKIKDSVFLDLEISSLTLQLADAPCEGVQDHQQSDEGAEEQRQEDVCPHRAA
jgi:hypothetical protein